jgi:hypothetical protein
VRLEILVVAFRRQQADHLNSPATRPECSSKKNDLSFGAADSESGR